MIKEITLSAVEKASSGSSHARFVRSKDMVPAIVYGGDKNLMLSISQKEIIKEYQKNGLESVLVKLNLDNKSIRAITREVQLHPVSDFPIHIDFQEVVPDKPVKVSVRVKVINSDKCKGIKKGGTLNIACRHIILMCYPESIPSIIEVDVADLEIGQSVHIKDLNLDSRLTSIDKSNFAILSIGGRIDEESSESSDSEAE